MRASQRTVWLGGVMSDGRVLGVFVKAPVAGQVKTRLAAEIGPSGAADLYRRLGRQVVAASVSDAYQTTVWYAPTGRGRLVREWLGALGVTRFRAQAVGHLGRRLDAAFARHFRDGARRVILIGSDCPGVDAGLVWRALAGLDESDLVLGPAHDGGYYLIGLRAPVPQLFRGIAWSTEAVLDQTLAQARRLRLSTVFLPTLRDVDTAGDARALRILPPGMAAVHPRQEVAPWLI